jgi:adenylosuccinate synthase
MKMLFTLLITCLTLLPSLAQETVQKVMEKRAREMHRVIGLSDQEQWKKFMKENYTQALIDKPMRAVTETSENDSTTPSTTSEAKTASNLDAKAAMFQRLHQDFGKSKIVSITPLDEKLEMVVKSDDGLNATFLLKFEKSKPYLIDGLGIEVQDEDR